MNNTSHPEDLIYKSKTFINELEEVQKVYFDRLVHQLNLNSEGEDFLFDYIYNNLEENTFEEYLQFFNKSYSQMVQIDSFHSGDFGDASAMLHMSSLEPDIHSVFNMAEKDYLYNPFHTLLSEKAELETSFPGGLYDEKFSSLTAR